jgi:hypothetical protein
MTNGSHASNHQKLDVTGLSVLLAVWPIIGHMLGRNVHPTFLGYGWSHRTRTGRNVTETEPYVRLRAPLTIWRHS